MQQQYTQGLIQIDKHLVELHNISKNDDQILESFQQTSQQLSDILKQIKTLMYVNKINADLTKIKQNNTETDRIPERQTKSPAPSLQDKIQGIMNKRMKK
ncbi:unnamed protein product [Paramecium pentaurelia]|uniref:Uncharacterized protein n=1 Tax=Paramecium pentaurelia TaxID=43138 RepID=A0A8S1UK80_9CILI|nr:unnamed protein product [Paramecium pentaurelia]